MEVIAEKCASERDGVEGSTISSDKKYNDPDDSTISSNNYSKNSDNSNAQVAFLHSMTPHGRGGKFHFAVQNFFCVFLSFLHCYYLFHHYTIL